MKLSKFNTTKRSNSGVELELTLLGSGDKSGVFITLLGRDGTVFRSIRDERSRAMTDRVQAGKGEYTPEEQDDMVCDTLSKLTLGWRNIEDDDGSELAFTKEKAYQIYRDHPAIREQANLFLADRGNFVLS
jgi:hypothetical protein